jgi:A/G-specific adenine glycosylase
LIPPTSFFAEALIAWHARHGRHDLPWQRDRSLYRVWVSEIMLQQTQVATVIPYYERFMARFRDLSALAAAPLDEVLHLWSGLGYYARARNLHRAAERVRDDFAGEFPTDFAGVSSLPGIGRSTAGAILALALEQRFAILDGNVRRVLARCFGVDGRAKERAVENRLWEISEACTPAANVALYTQSVMDLGATVCTRSRPLCALCPLTAECFARRHGRQAEFPAPRRSSPRAERRAKRTIMLVARRADGAVLLEKRPTRGIWGGLWCLPEFGSEPAARSFALRHLSAPELASPPLPDVAHSFTHFDLAIAPLLVACAGVARVMEGAETLWYNAREPLAVGLPAPVRLLLERLSEPSLVESSSPTESP